MIMIIAALRLLATPAPTVEDDLHPVVPMSPYYCEDYSDSCLHPPKPIPAPLLKRNL